MKKEYISPEMEIVKFETEDIMQSSGVTVNDLLNTWSDDWGFEKAW